jgi:hypothetical protein
MKTVIATAKAPHNRRVDFAMRTWTGAEVMEIECERTGDDRGCYFFKDVFDHALTLNSGDVFVYANNDVAFFPDWKRIVTAVQECGSAASSRTEVDSFEAPIKGTATHGGKDVFAFSPTWWKAVRHSLPDLLLGYEGYDFAVFTTMLQTGGKELNPPICYHETHHPFWRTVTPDNPVRIRERELCKQWIMKQAAEGCFFDYCPYGIYPPDRPRNLSTSAGNQRKNLSTSAELFL